MPGNPILGGKNPPTGGLKFGGIGGLNPGGLKFGGNAGSPLIGGLNPGGSRSASGPITKSGISNPPPGGIIGGLPIPGGIPGGLKLGGNPPIPPGGKPMLGGRNPPKGGGKLPIGRCIGCCMGG
tara:strand:- start:154 stop:525 length:372 start_codon:yes stop_codon:yes gene_type:complete